MIEALNTWYPWIKWLHLVAVISWMAGLLYLPRLFVYHVETDNVETKATFMVMERKLLRAIMNPAMILAWVLGILLMFATDALNHSWMLMKLVLILALTGFHGFCSKWRKDLEAGNCRKTGRFFRMANEIPTILMILIIGLVVLKPF